MTKETEPQASQRKRDVVKEFITEHTAEIARVAGTATATGIAIALLIRWYKKKNGIEIDLVLDDIEGEALAANDKTVAMLQLGTELNGEIRETDALAKELSGSTTNAAQIEVYQFIRWLRALKP